LDEIGRGTSTLDGLSIAQAVVEHIHNNIKCRTLFATHYHELTKLEETLPNAKCYHVAVKETEKGLTFVHKIHPGPSHRSYGLEVAKHAGIEEDIIKRGFEILTKLIQENELNTTLKTIQQELKNQEISQIPANDLKKIILNLMKIKNTKK